jgi:hypothetical protein
LNTFEAINQFVDEFEDFKPILKDHIEFNEELLPHVFLGDCNDLVIKLIKEGNPPILERLFNFYERMAIDGDEDVKNVLTVSILEVLGDDRKVLNIAYKYMGKETRKASDDIEKFWGRY